MQKDSKETQNNKRGSGHSDARCESESSYIKMHNNKRTQKTLQNNNTGRTTKKRNKRSQNGNKKDEKQPLRDSK